MEALSPMGETVMDTSSLASPQPHMMGMADESMDTVVMSPQPTDHEITQQVAPAPVFTQEGAVANQGLGTSFTGCLSNMVLPGLPNASGTPFLLNATSPTTVGAPFLLNQSTFTGAPAQAPQFLMNGNPNTTFILNTNPGCGNMQTFLVSNPNLGAQGTPFMVQTPVTNTTTFLVNSGMLNTSPNTLLLTHPSLAGSNGTLMLTTNQGAAVPQQVQPAPAAPPAETLLDASGEIKTQASTSESGSGIQLQPVQLPLSAVSGAPMLPTEMAQNYILQNLPGRSDSRSSSVSIPELEQAVVEENSLTANIKENKDMLALRLKLRRPREELVNQGIMPPLKSTPAFHEQRQRLERAKVGDSLQRKMRMRPDKAQLVHQHILEDTNMEPMVSATHQRLKRARIEQDLDSKIKNRPGPLELIEGNILKAEHFVEQAVKDGKVKFMKTTGMETSDNALFGCDEESTEGGCSDEPMSPSQPYSQLSDNPPSSVGSVPSPPDFTTYFEHHHQHHHAQQQQQQQQQHQQQYQHHQMIPTHCITSSSPLQTKIPSTTAPSIMIKQEPMTSPPSVSLSGGAVSSSSSMSSSKSGMNSSTSSSSSKNARKKQTKRNKPKEIKFHEYKPPNEQTSKLAIPPNGSNPYNLLLMQQQLLLQLQLLQQQHHQLILPNAPPTVGAVAAAQGKLSPSNLSMPSPSSTMVTSSSSPTPMQQQDVKPNVTLATKTKIPTNLEDMKVSELKLELKSRGLHVSGTKPQLIERLRPYVDVTTSPCSTANSTSQDVTSSSSTCSTGTGTKVTSSTDVTPDAASETHSNRASMSSPPVSPPDFKSPVSVASEMSEPASPGSAFDPTSPTFQMMPPPSVSHSSSILPPVASPPPPVSVFSTSSPEVQHQGPQTTTLAAMSPSQFNSSMAVAMDSCNESASILAEITDMGFGGDMQVSNEILRKQQQKIEELQRALLHSQQQLQQHQTQIMQTSPTLSSSPSLTTFSLSTTTKTTSVIAPPPPPPPPPPHPAAVAAAAGISGMSPPTGSSPIKLAGMGAGAGATPPKTLPSTTTMSPPTSLPISISPPQMHMSMSSPVKAQSPPKSHSPPMFHDFINQPPQRTFKFSSGLPAGQQFHFSAKTVTSDTKPTTSTNTNSIVTSPQKSSSAPSSPTESGVFSSFGVLPSYVSPPPNYEEAVKQRNERKQAHLGSLLNPESTENGEPRMTQSSDLDDLLEVLVDHGYQIPVMPKTKDLGRLPPQVASMPNLSLALTSTTSTTGGANLTPAVSSTMASSTSHPQLHHSTNSRLPPPPPPPHPQQQQKQRSPVTPMSIHHHVPSPLPMDIDAELSFPGLELSKSLPVPTAHHQSHRDLPPPPPHPKVHSPQHQHQQQIHHTNTGMLSTPVTMSSLVGAGSGGTAAMSSISADKDNGNLLASFDLSGMHVDGERDASFWTLGGDDVEASPSTGMLGQPPTTDNDMNWLDVMMSSSGSGLTPGNVTPPTSMVGGAEASLGNPLIKDSFSLNLFDLNDDAWDSIHVTE